MRLPINLISVFAGFSLNAERKNIESLNVKKLKIILKKYKNLIQSNNKSWYPRLEFNPKILKIRTVIRG